jgi:hypothetical protein
MVLDRGKSLPVGAMVFVVLGRRVLLNLWLTLKSMIRIISNYETVYLSIGLMSRVFFLEPPLFWDGR